MKAQSSLLNTEMQLIKDFLGNSNARVRGKVPSPPRTRKSTADGATVEVRSTCLRKVNRTPSILIVSFQKRSPSCMQVCIYICRYMYIHIRHRAGACGGR